MDVEIEVYEGVTALLENLKLLKNNRDDLQRSLDSYNARITGVEAKLDQIKTRLNVSDLTTLTLKK